MGKATDKKKYRYGLVEWFLLILFALATAYMGYENIIIWLAHRAGQQ